VQIRFVPLGIVVEAKEHETILDAARRSGAPLGNSCGAVGICARCRVEIVEGAQSLTPPTDIERRIGTQRGFASNERMACQAVVTGDCVVTTGYW
jgi:2Fe-2S ferredoxin